MMLILFVSWGDYLFFKTIQNIIYFKVRNIIELSHDKQLTELHIPIADFKTGKVHFEKEDEIIYKGNWYDIKRATIVNDVVVIVAYKDEEEKILVETWLKHFTRNNEIFKTLVAISFQVKIFYQQLPDLRITASIQNLKRFLVDSNMVDFDFVFDILKPPEILMR